MFQLGPVNAYAVVGDSKTQGYSCCITPNAGFRAELRESLGIFYEYAVAIGNVTTAGMRAVIDAQLAAFPSTNPAEWVLINLGTNDVPAMPSQATWESDMGYILDAIHTKWPAARVRLMRPWRRGYAVNLATLAGWIDNVLAARAAWAATGPDERVFLKGGDDGATYTDDGVHANAAGYALTAVEWQTALGY